MAVIVDKDIGLSESRKTTLATGIQIRGGGGSYRVDSTVHHVMCVKMPDSLGKFNQLVNMISYDV